jgi:uncharacterized radical SAM protein YgiQ
MNFLPTTLKECKARGWEQLDVILISGDAYVDHPSFGSAVIGRYLEAMGLKVALIPQPNWRDDLRDFTKLGEPRLFFGVSAGVMDSMVNHYTANKRRRSDDAYTPGGQAGFRPDRALSVYCRILKKKFPNTPVLAGGIEASLRRFTHYDYWEDRLHPSVLADCGADILLYGMGEKSLEQIVRLLQKGVPLDNLKTVPQTAVLLDADESLPRVKKWEDHELHSHELCLADKKAFADNFRHIETESNKWHAKRLLQQIGQKLLVVNPPWSPMKSRELDKSFDLPFTRLPHPKYKKRGEIPAYNMIRHSINLHRGCFGGCAFCTISAHQGKFVVSRSVESIMKELEAMVHMPDFRGTVSDLGGPSANMFQQKGLDETLCEQCKRPSCLYPKVCNNLNTDHKALLDIYKRVRNHNLVKHAFVTSGLRYDAFIGRPKEENEKNHHLEFLETIVKHHTSGRLKVAPEHTSDAVLKVMRKPGFDLFYEMKELFDKYSQEAGKNQQLIPYFISSHPGSRESDMKDLAEKTQALGFNLEQVQGFTPTPMTLSTVIYYSGYHPYTLKPVYTAHTKKEREAQHQYFFRGRKGVRKYK